jgi:uncharacterized protein (TIGR02186 family)
MIRAGLAVALLISFASPGPAEEIVSGLSQSRVAITADFDGSEILLYGAVKRDAPAPEGPLDVIITVQGPDTPLIIRRKERVAGVWLNQNQVRVDSAPSFYAIATTGPLTEILSETEDLRHDISLRRVIRAVGISAESDRAPEFVEALMRVRSQSDAYRLDEGSVELTAGTLFRADVVLPSNLTEGEYRVRLFLTRGGRVVAMQNRAIDVRKEGLERIIFTAAHERPLAYGLVSLALAALAGWGASAAFRYLRP